MDRIFLTLLMLSAIPAITLAQGAPPTSGGAADPAMPVATPVYRSAFGTTPIGVATDTLDWAQANADVGQFQRGHMDIVMWERAEQAKALGMQPPPAAQKQEGAQ